MATVVEVHGYAVRVFTRDHGNPHVHVFHRGSLMKIWLSPLAFDSHKGREPRQAEIARALQVVAEHRAACLAKWIEIHA
ncbi:MAG: DUF4160 domain-containing protein [Candidatus Eremiobacteraeota bacterium]|nr:DUF4160 domain-containing protein [Candidatus Eremiobacteraeota bacterium]